MHSMQKFKLVAEYYAKARKHYDQGEEQESWMELLHAAEINWAPEASPKQLRQRQLWRQRGLLELTRANLRNCCVIPQSFESLKRLEAARDSITFLINRNQQLMRENCETN